MKKPVIVCAVLLASALLVFGPSTARAISNPNAEPVSDILQFTWDGVMVSKTISGPGEAVGEEIDFTFPTGTSTFDQTNFTSDFVYLVEPGTVTSTNTDGTVNGFRSDQLQAKVSHESGASTTTVTVTMNSDEDPGTHDPVRGFLENGSFIDVTNALFRNILDGSGHTALVLAFSDVEATTVPEPTSMLLLGFGLVGLAGVRRKMK